MTEYLFNGDLRKKAHEITWDEIQNHLDITIKGSLNLIQELFKNMKKNNFGRIINVGTNLFQNPVVPYHDYIICLLYTSPSPRDDLSSRMPSSA